MNEHNLLPPTILVKLKEEVWEKLQAQARIEGLSVEQIMQLALSEYLDRYGGSNLASK